jgi:hypothetical protein
VEKAYDARDGTVTHAEVGELRESSDGDQRVPVQSLRPNRQLPQTRGTVQHPPQGYPNLFLYGQTDIAQGPALRAMKVM